METPPQNTDENELAAILKTGGVDDPAFHSLYGTWMIIQQRLADASEDPDRARIEIDVKRADMYFNGGHLGLALECLETAEEQAHQKGMDNLKGKIKTKIKQFKSLT